MLTFTDNDVKRPIGRETGIRSPIALEAFGDVEDNVRQSIVRLEASHFIAKKSSVRGFVYDVRSGRLSEVKVPARQRT